MNTTYKSEKPVTLSQAELTTIGRLLPAGATLVGGVVLSSDRKTHLSASSGASVTGGNCVDVIYALDDHTIHSATICGSGS
jgi:hypothetical protein